VLPYAAAIVTDRSGTVRFAEIQSDWSTPADPGRIVNAVAASSPPRPVGRRRSTDNSARPDHVG